MKVTFYTTEDSVYIELDSAKVVGGKDLDDRRHLDIGANEQILGVEFLQVSEGVDLQGLPGEVVRDIEPGLRARNVRVLVP